MTRRRPLRASALSLDEDRGGERVEYIYGAMLLHVAGQEVNEANLKSVLKAAGLKPNDARIKALAASLEDVDIEEAIKGAVAAPIAPAPGPEEKKPDEKKPDEKKPDEKEAKKKKAEEEVSEEEAAAGLGALFGM